MRRRRVLSVLSAGLAGLAGCEGLPDGGSRRDPYDVPGESGDPGNPSPLRVQAGEAGSVLRPAEATRSVSTGRRRLVLARTPMGTPISGTTLSAGFTSPPTETSPATVWVGLTNGGTAERTVTFGPTPPFSAYRGEDESGASLVLVPAGERQIAGGDPIPDAPTNGRWVATRPVTATASDRTTERTLETGETVAGEYYLLATPGNRPRRSVYRFGPDPVGLSIGVGSWEQTATPDSTFEGEYPGVPAGDRTAWYHRGGSPIVLEPQRERVRAGQRCRFGLTNSSHRPVDASAGTWDLYRQTERGWDRVDGGTGQRVDRLAAGGTREFSLGLGEEPPPPGADADLSATAAVEPGLHAVNFGATTVGRAAGPVSVHGEATLVWTPPPSPDPGEDRFGDPESVVFGALVRVLDDPPEETGGDRYLKE